MNEKTTVNFQLYLHRKIAFLKKKCQITWKQTKPFLTMKYWPIYAISFALGFWLWGPAHGWRTINNHRFWRSPQLKTKTQTTEALQRQLTQLRHELKIVQIEKKVLSFDPTNFSRPALGEVIRGYDWFETENSWRLHAGVDIKLPVNSNVIAAAAGTIIDVREITPADFSVTIDHGNGWTSVYSHLSKVLVIQGQSLIKGVILGISGNSGCEPRIPSIHFGIYHNQQPIDPHKIIPEL